MESTARLYQDYLQWSGRVGTEHMSLTAFGRHFSAMGLPKVRLWGVETPGVRHWYRVGIKLEA